MRSLVTGTLAVALVACSPAKKGPDAPPKVDLLAHAQTAVAAPDRDAEDPALDAGRKPAEVLSFCGVGPGAKVADLGAGRGYTTELLARIVGPGGKVWAQNNKFVLEKFAEAPWAARLKKPIMANVVRVDREFDDPLPADAKGLDAVVMVLFYHDSVWLETDRAKMNKAIFAALAPGGTYCVVDHAAAAGHGFDDVKTLHRIEAAAVVKEVTAAGFTVAGKSAVLANPADTHDWNDSPSAAAEKRGTSDRFVIKFVRP